MPVDTAPGVAQDATGDRAYLGASQSAIAHHYDVGNDFVRLWLDPTMTYSCALWGPGDTLEAAQLRKLDYMLDCAHVANGKRVLDIGCGWGSLLRRAVNCGSSAAVGLTLSREQYDSLSGWPEPQIEVYLKGWSDFQADEPFDSIVSIGAFEHFARSGLSREEQITSYRRFFECCHQLLRPGSWMSLQTITKGDIPVDRQGLRDILLIVKHMFPESQLPYPADVIAAAEGYFEITSMRNDRLDYARTCRAWLDALRSQHEQAAAIAGERTAETYTRYLEACVRQFDRGHAALCRFAMRRQDTRGSHVGIAARFSAGAGS
jgi:cyclopropane-fatty-acyl-phospholipid synthase